MAKKKSSSTAEVVAKPAPIDDDDDVEVEEEVELLQVDVGDIMKVKQILDETVAESMISEGLSAHGDAVQLQEAYTQGNIKLGLMTLACVFAAVAQFGLKGAELSSTQRIWLGVCCVCYFGISGVLQLIMTFVDKDCIMLIQPLTDPEAVKLIMKNGGNKYLDKYGIRVRTQFPRYSEYYTIILEFEGGGPARTEFVKQTWSVGQFFDVDGYFDEEGLMLEVEALYRRFEAGKFDKPDNGEGGSNTSKEKKNK
jgi:signal peptidase complex subunit 2